MATEAPLLEARAIGRRHRDGSVWLIRDVSLAVNGGSCIALTGPTGSGKTVLLRALAMLDAIEEGGLSWQGKAPRGDEVPVYRSQVIYLTQRACLLEGTVEQNLQVPFSLAVHRGIEYSREKILAYLDHLRRDDQFLARDSANLSGGEAQVVALLRAIQLDPAILLLDEPTASLDEATTRQIEQLVAAWISEAAPRRAFVWVTHDAGQANRVANRRIQVSDGRLVEREAG